MNENQTNPPQLSVEPYLAHPGETIHISFRIHPDDCLHLNYQLTLVFLTQPPPFQATTLPINVSSEPLPTQAYLNEKNQQANAQAEELWIAQHPGRSLMVPATLSFLQEGTIEIIGTISDPRNLTLHGNEPPESEAIYPEVYSLQPFQLSEQFPIPFSAPIAPDAQATQAIASYRIRFDQLYQKRPSPPPPKTEYISDLQIAPPTTSGLSIGVH